MEQGGCSPALVLGRLSSPREAVGVPLNTLLRAQGSVRALGHAEGSPGGRRQFCSEITGARHRARVTVTGGGWWRTLVKVI